MHWLAVAPAIGERDRVRATAAPWQIVELPEVLAGCCSLINRSAQQIANGAGAVARTLQVGLHFCEQCWLSAAPTSGLRQRERATMLAIGNSK